MAYAYLDQIVSSNLGLDTKVDITAFNDLLGNAPSNLDTLGELATSVEDLTTVVSTKAPQSTTYTKTETDARIQLVVGAAPAALDTLAEIATQLASDESAASALTSSLSTHTSDATKHLTAAQNTLLDAIETAGTTAAEINTLRSSGITNADLVKVHAVTSTATELNYVAGVTSAIQTQLSSKADSTTTTNSLALKAPLANPVFTGTQTFVGIKETKVAMAANNIDLATGTVFSKTISGATTLTVSNVPATGLVGAFILNLTNGGSAAITWFSGVKWVSGTAPTLTSSGRDRVGFITEDGGTTWDGFVMGKDLK